MGEGVCREGVYWEGSMGGEVMYESSRLYYMTEASVVWGGGFGLVLKTYAFIY